MAAVSSWFLWGGILVFGILAVIMGVALKLFATWGMIVGYLGLVTFPLVFAAWAYESMNKMGIGFQIWWGSYVFFGSYSYWFAFCGVEDLREWTELKSRAYQKEPDYSCCATWDWSKNPVCTCK